jgi:hypothetical protein
MGIACGRDHVKMVSLLQPYVDLSVANKMGERPFHVAVRSNAASVVSYLLKSFPHDVLVGPDFLPVWEAVAHGSVDTLPILLNAGKFSRFHRRGCESGESDSVLLCCDVPLLFEQVLMQPQASTASRRWTLPRGSTTRRWLPSSPSICNELQRSDLFVVFPRTLALNVSRCACLLCNRVETMNFIYMDGQTCKPSP